MNCLCFKPAENKLKAKATIKAHLSVTSKNEIKLVGKSKLSNHNSILIDGEPTIKGTSEVKAHLSAKLDARSKLTSKVEVVSPASLLFTPNHELLSNFKIGADTSKFAGDFKPNDCYDKLYPSQDLNKLNFVGVSNDLPVSSDLYALIDEGVYTGDYHLNNKTSESLYSWDDYIESSGEETHAEFSVLLTPPSVSFQDSFIIFNVESYNSKHRIYDIEFKDDEGNLICKYDDIEFIGDNQPTMHSARPSINNGAAYTWKDEYPNMPSSGSLSFKTEALCIDDADGFDDGFDEGFERCSDLHNPKIKISAIEICNSGDFGFRRENFLPTFVEVRAKGDRLEKCIEPTRVLPKDFETSVWPTVETSWENTYGYNNDDIHQGGVLALDLAKPYDYSNITLVDTSVADSGKLNLLFEHKPQEFAFGFKDGAFGLGFNSDEFSVAEAFKEKDFDNWYLIDEIYLKVRAKKAEGSRDYTLDVVGWSDDELLNVTSQTGGFIQNASGTGEVPTVSGWNNLDNEGISSESISEQDEYYELSAGPDHYELYQNVVNSTTYEDYKIPLKINIDEFKLGLEDFSSLSFFEKLFLDIYPLPSGASISHLELCVSYTPSNALHFSTLAGNVGVIDVDRSEGRLIPQNRNGHDLINNAGSGYGPVSLIESIPVGYSTPDDIKTNYSRRWRPVEGISMDAFNPNEFGFGFESHQLDTPFNLGHFLFDKLDGGNVVTSYSVPDSISFPHKNRVTTSTIGARFRTDTNGSINTYESLAEDDRTSDSFIGYMDLNDESTILDVVDLNDGFGFFARFIPKDVPSNAGHLIIKRSEFNLQFSKGANEFTLWVFDENSVRHDYSLSLPDDSYYPVSVLFTYNDNLSERFKLYVLNEKDGSISKLVSDPINKFNNNEPVNYPFGQVTLGHSNDYIGLDCKLVEFGFSSYNASGSLIIDEDDGIEPDLLYKQQAAQSFLRSISPFWSESGNAVDNSVLPSYIDENVLDWDLGAFNWKEFTPHEFDMFTDRVGRDAVNFRLYCDGSPYSDKTDLALPTSIDSGVSYHTQLENDFLRVNLSDTSDNFYSAAPRIMKTLPRGYQFEENAIVADTVISYSQSGDITWPNGEKGPKLIVSLYTRNQEDAEIETDNWGIVNRKVHYLNLNNRWSILSSTFDLDSFLDESEPWSVFPEDRRLTEFDHKYYSDDVDQMFLQYDLVTPSGDEFEVNLNIHTANVRMENALVVPTETAGILNIYTSGEQYSNAPMVMRVDGIGLDNEYMNLHLSGVPTPVDLADVSLCTSGAYFETAAVDLHTINQESGVIEMPLYTSGNYRVEAEVNLVTYNDQSAIPSDMFLQLHNMASANNPELFRWLNMTAYSSVNRNAVEAEAVPFGSLPMISVASRGYLDVYRENSFNLHTIAPTEFGEQVNLYLFGDENPGLVHDSFFNLHNHCFPRVYLNGSGNESMSWNSRNYGFKTEESDEYAFRVPSAALIRGIDTICYGDCSNEENKCVEQDLVTHDTSWVDEECIDGGVLRPSRTYTYNPSGDVFSVEDPESYNQHFYGTRKYQGLYPNSPYEITAIGRKGSKKSIELPPVWKEWEYGSLGPIDFEGFKLTGDHPFIESGRNPDDSYGYTTRVKDDILGVGAPGHNLGPYKEAGSIFLYRRQDAEGGEKGYWDLETKLTLPSGFIGDWFYDRGGSISFPGLGTIPERQWNIGQEGRELGHSFDISVHNGKEVIVAGGPGAKWTTRSFEEIETSGVNVAIMVVNNEFNYSSDDIDEILENLELHNFMYKYFADPAVHINLHLISCIPTGIFDPDVYVDPQVEDYLTIQKIPRAIPTKPEDPAITEEMLSGMQNAFLSAFPYDESKVNNNIPPIVGFYVDNSRSLGRPVVEPAIDQFVDFYHSYSFNSGVVDFFGTPSSGYIYEYIPTETDKGEDWFAISNKLINEVLDTGNMYDTDTYRLVTSGIGLEHANEEAIEFNINPDSGGRVYVFEREFDEWSLVQEIRSPNSSYSVMPARFGHSVSMSEDTNTLAIGSPYIQESCAIYEFAEGEKNRLYDNIGRWLEFRDASWVTLGQYYNILERYNELEEASGVREAGKQIYSELDTTNRFKARSDYDFWKNNHIQEYKKVYNYGLDDVRRGLTGTFTKTMMQNAPNPRLGYSSSVNEDGKVVAFGSPTDSLGQYDDAGFYFLHRDGFYLTESGEPEFPRNLWASNVNAGAVRLFEKGEDFEPISERKVLEYNKFGNLSNTLNNTEGYDEEGNETNSTTISNNGDYDKTDFADVSIPDDVGSIFIITPEIDAANDEVIEEIKSWMALGDRRLVLVGDDPVWENDGAYAQSNEIINKILEKLDSRMRLHPARNKREALIDGVFCSGDQVTPNVIKSYTPAGSNETNVNLENHLFGYGVADIRLHVPNAIFKEDNWGKDHTVVDNKRYGNCSFYNPKCGPPIAHNGDLRARWTEREIKFPPNPNADDPYTYWERNLPFEFYSNGLPPVKPDDASDIANDLSLVAQGEQPRPLMVAAEFSENYATIPAKPEIKVIRPITETVCTESNTSVVYYTFSDQHEEELAFYWTEGSGNQNFVNINIGNNTSEGVFYNPEEFNGRDALLQADGTLDIEVTREELTELFEVDDYVEYVNKEEILGSTAYLIAGVGTEDAKSLQFGNDENISFYDNLVRKENCDNASILQIGSWTLNNSFVEAYEDSLLGNLFPAMGHNLEEGWSGNVIPASKDVVWIADPKGEPSEAQLNAIKTWLSLGDKQIVLTYDETEEQSSRMYRICEALGLTMKPWYLAGANLFPTTATKYVSNSSQVKLSLHDKSIISCVEFGPNEVEEFARFNRFCPINGGTRVVWYEGSVKDERLNVTEEYKNILTMNTGVTKVQFPAIPGSGYRIFYNWIADRPEEKQEIGLYAGDVLHRVKPNTRAQNPDTLSVNGGVRIWDFDDDRDIKTVDYASTNKIRLPNPSFGTAVSEDYIDVQVPNDKDYINLFFTGNKVPTEVRDDAVPTTFKILSVSGAPLPINRIEEFRTSEVCETIEVGYEEIVTQEYVPPSTVLLPATVKPIMNLNDRYCLTENSCGGKLVADGPVVIAEEPEHFSDFASGKSRSQIVLISDSTIVNGCLGEPKGSGVPVSGAPTVPESTALSHINQLLSSLSVTSTTQVGTKEQLNNSYSFIQKIVSPEKGSPAIYSLLADDMGGRFGGFTGGNLEDFGDENNYSQGKMVQNIHEQLHEFEEAERDVLGEFASNMGTFGNSKFSYEINGKVYEDTPLSGNPFSELLRETGKDFLNYDFSPSGYPGDLFGHSVGIHNDKVVVGSPYSAYTSGITNISGMEDVSHMGELAEVGKQGGGGSAYVFEKDIQVGWNATNKLKDESVRSLNNSDRFGWSISTDGDFVAIGAPGHDFGNNVVYNKGAFVRKEFDASFDIGTRTVTSLGAGESGVDLNTGAIFTFENKLVEWSTREKEWTFAEKIVPHGYMSGEYTSSFGNSVSIARHARSDSDYVLSVGSHKHTFGVDNTYTQESGAGAAYTYDAMLRFQPPSTFSEDSWLNASIFGLNRELDEVNIEIRQDSPFVSNEEVLVKGLVYSDERGQIFLEASGQDPREFGYMMQRPYIERVEGTLVHGTPIEDMFNLHSYTDAFSSGNDVNLFIQSQESDTVYNNLDLITYSAYSGSGEFNLLVQADTPTEIDNSGLIIHSEAIGFLEPTMNLRIRGK